MSSDIFECFPLQSSFAVYILLLGLSSRRFFWNQVPEERCGTRFQENVLEPSSRRTFWNQVPEERSGTRFQKNLLEPGSRRSFCNQNPEGSSVTKFQKVLLELGFRWTFWNKFPKERSTTMFQKNLLELSLQRNSACSSWFSFLFCINPQYPIICLILNIHSHTETHVLLLCFRFYWYHLIFLSVLQLPNSFGG